MTVKEALERIKEIGLPAAAKELEVDRHRLQQFLREIGAQHRKGTKEWLYEAVSADILAVEIHTRVHKVYEKRTGKKTKAENNIQQPRKAEKSDIIMTENKPTNKKTKKVTYEIEEELHDELKIKAIREKRTVSEIVSELIKKGME